jgi:pimeloyl-ACP methyl ester carboxylesterase
MRFVARIARAVPSALVPFWGDVALDTLRREPGPGGALLQGLFFGRIAPPRSERRKIKTRTLILGHSRDPVHPFSDADMLAGELENSSLVQASSIIELRRSPERLTGEIAAFLDEIFATPARKGRARSAS